MKYTATVTTTTTIELSVDDAMLTEPELDDFEKGMFTLDSQDTRANSLISFIAIQIADQEPDSIEGVGKVVRYDLVRESNPVVRYEILDVENEVEISEET